MITHILVATALGLLIGTSVAHLGIAMAEQDRRRFRLSVFYLILAIVAATLNVLRTAGIVV